MEEDDSRESVLLFDVDGTICESSKEIDSEMRDILHRICLEGRYDICIVGGGTLEKIKKQMGEDLLDCMKYVCTECGSVVYHKNECIYHNYIQDHPLYPLIQNLLDVATTYIEETPYEKGDHRIDIRSGLVYISMVGMDATDEMRRVFKEVDATMKYRKSLMNRLLHIVKELGASISIVYGGEVGLSIYPSEWDKVQVISMVEGYREIHFFGDRFEEDGNDYQLIHHPRIIGHKVNGVHDTKRILLGDFCK